MALTLTPIKLADINIGSSLTDNWGRPTPYGQRWWNGNNANIQSSINGLQAVIAELEAQQAELEAAQAELEAQQLQIEGIVADLTDVVNQQADILDDLAAQQVQINNLISDLSDTVDFLAYYVNYVDLNIRGYINTYVRGGAVRSGDISANTSVAGLVTIAHGAGVSPSTGAVNIQMIGTTAYCVNVFGYDSTNIVAYVWDPTTGAAAAGVTVNLIWNMWFWDALPSVPVA